MNSKKNKHKKSNKNIQNLPKHDEAEASETKESVVVTEITTDMPSEVPEPAKEEVQVLLDTETPKKPKRNRGKKKKGNENEECEEGKLTEPVEPKVELQSPLKEENVTHTEKVETIEVPTARKNKNKNKCNEPAIPVINTEPPSELSSTKEIEEQNLEIMPTEFLEESKSLKKKNKKKKRNYSDRSDKNPEVSCTAAFEDLLAEEGQTDRNQGEVQTKEDIAELKQVVDDLGIKVETEEIKSDIILEKQSEIQLESDTKSKKKGKKEKKMQTEHYAIENVDDIKPILTEGNVVKSLNAPENPSEGKSSDVVKSLKLCASIEESISSELPKQEIGSKEEFQKPKAKIAKPVEKKHTGKREIDDLKCEDVRSEDICIRETLTPIQEISPFTVTEETDEGLPVKSLIEDINLSTLEKAETKLKEEVLKSFETPEPISFKESENVTSKNKKKRKQIKVPENSPEGQIEKEHQKQPEDNVLLDAEQSHDKNILDESIKLEDKDHILFESLVLSDPVTTTEEIVDKIIESISQSDESNKAEIKTLEPSLDNHKMKKKGRKSPKLPLELGEGSKIAEIKLGTTAVEEKKDIEQTQDEGTGSTTLEEIEIRSCKSEESPCDVAPEIHYPRSTSQQLDDNNNMVIREILNDDLLNIPISTPTNIQGSGETPIGSPQMVSSGIKITEVEASSKAEEKTDLKSKMMEVNQDMEELRMSIERSLAELTSMEDNEKVPEKQYEKKSETEAIPQSAESLADREVKQQIEKEPTYEELAIEENPKIITENICINEGIVKSIPEEKKEKSPNIDEKVVPIESCSDLEPPVCPARKDNKGKGKKRKGKQETVSNPSQTQTETAITNTDTEKKDSKQKQDEKTEQKSDSTQAKSKQKSDLPSQDDVSKEEKEIQPVREQYEPIENFEDALSTVDDLDVNKSFEMILNEVTEEKQQELADNKPEIKIIGPDDTKATQSVPQPKNLLGHPAIPASSNRADYKKEKNKPPNSRQARVKIKDSNDIESSRTHKEIKEKKSKTDLCKINESFSQINQNEDFVYKYSFRKVFLQSSCLVCKKDLIQTRVPCKRCNLVFYCSKEHCSVDGLQHKDLCNAIKIILKFKDSPHIYSDAQGVVGHNYRLLRMEMILACEKELKRRLVPWEQEALLYPRMCADVWCRKWEQDALKDCERCGQMSYCANSPDHLPKSHQRWCKSYSLYQKLVTYQQTKGRLDLKMPTRVMSGLYQIPDNMNEVLASMYEEKIDMSDIQYAALTQIATAPLTALYSYQLYRNASPTTNGINKNTNFTIHVVGAELQFEADMLNKWEVFFLHLRPEVKELKVVLIGTELNPGNLPLELLEKTRMCADCRMNQRRLVLSFHDKTGYSEYKDTEDFILPDIVCAFNPAIHRSSVYNGKDPWPSTLTTITRLRIPFLVTAHTITELQRDLVRIKECCEVKVTGDPKHNPFASVRPDRNFISDDEAPLLFKNYCFMILNGF
ncbi:nuclear-pore anchor-like isoform X1 [Bombyx mandarina]|uniref:MYND-type domain-containing protein n=2 Tax=Bombyx TaxID=7090 RepID=A0A8R2AL66_BOMMO|nr:nuclear-pore anchor isoform X1 [Bombyx mori]XP_028035354.1 nuclear-pore anchor-like isoform X1 [Bombyx mandarina]